MPRDELHLEFAAIARLESLLRKATRAKELKQIQCVFLAAITDWPYTDIGRVVGVDETVVGNAVRAYRSYGEGALLTADHGYARRHAKLSLAEEEELLVVLAKEHAEGTCITASYAHARLRVSFGRSLPRSLVYSLFERHGWKSDGRRGPPESGFQPPEGTAPSRYQPRRATGNLSKLRGPEHKHLMSEADERQVLEGFAKRIEEGQPISRGQIQAGLAKAAGRPLSRQTVRRVLLRHNWRPIKRGNDTIWVTGEPDIELLLKRATWQNPRSSLTELDERALLADLEKLIEAGRPVLSAEVRRAISVRVGRRVSLRVVDKFLRRNGFRPNNRGAKSIWVRDESSKPNE